jgi:hypothetical protein
MTNRLWACVALLALGLTLPFVYGQSSKLVSGPQVGDEVPGPFHPLNVTGEAAGMKKCLYCAYGEAPVAVVFARDLTPQVAALIKQIDATTVKHKTLDMGSFAVFCSDDEKLKAKLEAFAAKEKIDNLVLTIDNPTGPAAYKIAKDADVTVVYYQDHKVAANHTFRTGELKDADVARVASDVKTILPK